MRDSGFSGKPNRLSRLWSKIAGVLLVRSWLLVILFFAGALTFEVLEHQNVENPIDIHFALEVIFFGIIYPVIVSLIWKNLLKAQQQRSFLHRLLELEQELNAELSSASDWEDLCNKIVNFPVKIAPVVGTYLLLVSEDATKLELQAHWRLVERSQGRGIQTALPINSCGVSNHELAPNFHVFVTDNPDFSSPLNVYCLPLLNQDRWLASIHIYAPYSEHLTSDQISILNSIAPTIAIALGTDKRKHGIDYLTTAVRSERERIARHLHDTLGQNVAYLRLKLDHLSMETMLRDIASIRHDIDRMRDAAYEAHMQLRQTLGLLISDTASDLTELLLQQAEAIAEQAGFTVRLHSSGEAIPLAVIIQRKIHAIFREALYNVAKHAHANKVDLSIFWDASGGSLTISLEDDGIGFEMNQATAPGHFGIIIMQQRADEIDAELTIISAPTKGTRVVLHQPLSQT